MDETYERPTASSSEKKETSSRWARTGFYMNVESDIKHGRFRVPVSNEEKQQHHELMLKSARAEVSEKKDTLDEIVIAEDKIRTAFDIRSNLEKGVPPKNSAEQELMKKRLKEIRDKKIKITKKRVKANAEWLKAQEYLNSIKPSTKSVTKTKNETVFQQGGLVYDLVSGPRLCRD